jgi:hypothetical protein
LTAQTLGELGGQRRLAGSRESAHEQENWPIPGLKVRIGQIQMRECLGGGRISLLTLQLIGAQGSDFCSHARAIRLVKRDQLRRRPIARQRLKKLE